MKIPSVLLFAAPQEGELLPQGVVALGKETSVPTYRFYVFYSKRQGREFLVQADDYPEREQDVRDLEASPLPEDDAREPLLVAEGALAQTLVMALCAYSDSPDKRDPERSPDWDIFEMHAAQQSLPCAICCLWLNLGEDAGEVSCLLIVHSLEQYLAFKARHYPGEDLVDPASERFATLGLPKRSANPSVVVLGELVWDIWCGLELLRDDVDAITADHRMAETAMKDAGISPGAMTYSSSRFRA